MRAKFGFLCVHPTITWVRSFIYVDLPTSARKDDALINQYVELVPGPNLQRGLDVHVPLNSPVSPAYSLGEIPPHRVRGGGLGSARRASGTVISIPSR